MPSYYVYLGLAVWAALVIWFMIKTDKPKSNLDGEWVMEVCLLGDYGKEAVAFRNKYKDYITADKAGIYYAQRLRTKLLKQNGAGSFTGSIRVNGKDKVVQYSVIRPHTDMFKYSQPIDTYNIV